MLYRGSMEAFAAERDPVREEQQLQTLPVFERGLDPQEWSSDAF